MTKESMSSWLQSVIAVTIAMVSFWMVEARHYTTRDETVEMIKMHIFQSPYTQDKSLIFDSLSNLKELQRLNNENLVKALKENTDAINQLKISIAVINKDNNFNK